MNSIDSDVDKTVDKLFQAAYKKEKRHPIKDDPNNHCECPCCGATFALLVKNNGPDFQGFADEVIDLGWEVSSLDGSDIQQLAQKYGLLKPKQMLEPCNLESCNCLDCWDLEDFAAGKVQCYRKTYLQVAELIEEG